MNYFVIPRVDLDNSLCKIVNGVTYRLQRRQKQAHREMNQNNLSSKSLTREYLIEKGQGLADQCFDDSLKLKSAWLGFNCLFHGILILLTQRFYMKSITLETSSLPFLHIVVCVTHMWFNTVMDGILCNVHVTVVFLMEYHVIVFIDKRVMQIFPWRRLWMYACFMSVD